MQFLASGIVDKKNKNFEKKNDFGFNEPYMCVFVLTNIYFLFSTHF